MTSEETVLRALDGMNRISWNTLLDRIRALGEEPCGMVFPLRSLERAGVIRQLDRQGRAWGNEYGAERGPLYIELRVRV